MTGSEKKDNLVSPEVLQLREEASAAKELAESLGLEDLRKGGWFIRLVTKAMESYSRNGQAEYFREKYPGLPPDDLAELLGALASKYAAIAGGVTGGATTLAVTSAPLTAGASLSVWLPAIATELLLVSALQIRHVLDLATVYSVTLDPEDPEDLLVVFSYALGIAPAELLGKGLQSVARGAGGRALQRGLAKGLQSALRAIGVKVLQRSIVKIAVPGVSIAIASTYNYASTRTLSKVATAHLRNRGRANAELSRLVSRSRAEDLAFPAAALYMAAVQDGVSTEERQLYRTLLEETAQTGLSLDASLQRMVASEGSILEVLATLDDTEAKRRLIELLGLFAAYDGDIGDSERAFLLQAGAVLGIDVDLARVEEKALRFKLKLEERWTEKVTRTSENALRSVSSAVSGTGNQIGRAATRFKRKLKSVVARTADPTQAQAESSTNDPIRALLEARAAFDAGKIDATEYRRQKSDALARV